MKKVSEPVFLPLATFTDDYASHESSDKIAIDCEKGLSPETIKKLFIDLVMV